MLRHTLGRMVTQRAVTRRALTPVALPSGLRSPLLLFAPPAAASRLLHVSALFTQKAADVYSAAASPASSGAAPTAGGAHHPPPPPPPGGIGRIFDRDRGNSDRRETPEEQAARYFRNMYFMTWVILLAVLFDWWNSSIAAGGALYTAQEVKTVFNELLQLIQREDTLLRAEVVALNDNTRRTRDELRQELSEVRRDMIAVLLSEGRGEAGRQLSRLFAGEDGPVGGGGGGWFSSLAEKAAEKTGLRGGGGGGSGRGGGERGDRGGDSDLGSWDAGFMSGLRAQLVNLAGGEGGKGSGQPQQTGNVDPSVVDDRYKAAMGSQ